MLPMQQNRCALAHLLHARPIYFSQQRKNQSLLARTGRAIKEGVGAVTIDHLRNVDIVNTLFPACLAQTSMRPCRKAKFTSFRRLSATFPCNLNCSSALGRNCTVRVHTMAGLST
jgi:hypothetical protein